jgi:hypothetical protein
MLQYGRFKLLFDTVPEGVLITVHDSSGFICEVVDSDVRSAVMAAIAAAELSLD